MKKLFIFLVAIFAFVAFANAQNTFTLANDTLTDATTSYSAALNSSTSMGTLVMQVTFTQISGTSAGSAYLQGSVDGTSFTNITDIQDMFTVFPDDTVTVANGTVASAIIKNSPFKYYRWKYVPTGTQSTKAEHVYLPKLR